MSETNNTTRFPGQVSAFLLVIVAFGCCFCGFAQSMLIWLTPPNERGPLQLPGGVTASPELSERIYIINVITPAVIALTILAVAIGIWYLFGGQQKRSNLKAKTGMVAAFVTSFAFFLWGILIAVISLLTDGFIITGQTLGAASGVVVAGVCILPAIVLLTVGIAIRYFFDRPVAEIAVSENPPPAPPTLALSWETYTTFINNLLAQQPDLESGQQTILWQSATARTNLFLENASLAEKHQLLLFLYSRGLITSPPLIDLRGADLTDVNLSGHSLDGIHLVGVNLRQAKLRRCSLQRANLQHSNLVQADLTETHLVHAQLQHADLAQAKCHQSNLHQADLTGANLEQANFWQADLMGAVVTAEQLVMALSVTKNV